MNESKKKDRYEDAKKFVKYAKSNKKSGKEKVSQI